MEQEPKVEGTSSGTSALSAGFGDDVRGHQEYKELSWIIDAFAYANSPVCPKEAAKHIKILVRQADSYRNAMHKWQDKVAAVKKALSPNE